MRRRASPITTKSKTSEGATCPRCRLEKTKKGKIASCHLAPLAVPRSMPCHRGGGKWNRSTHLPCRRRQGGGRPDPCHRGGGHQLVPLVAAKSEVGGTGCWGGDHLACTVEEEFCMGGRKMCAAPEPSTTAWLKRNPTTKPSHPNDITCSFDIGFYLFLHS
jgi:hypothetical protein